MATQETVKSIKDHLARYGLSEEDLLKVDPYSWGGHWHRTLLWIVRGHLKIIKPEDTKGQVYMLAHPSFQDGVSWAMRSVESGERQKAFEQFNDLNLQVISEPKKRI